MILTTDPVFAAACPELAPILVPSLETAPTVGVEGIVLRLGVKLDAALVARFPELRFVATVTTGLDHLDLTVLAARGVHVISLKGETAFLRGIHATPEHTWALLLALVRRVVPAVQRVAAGEWRREGLFGEELDGKTFGILGCGRVGARLARYAQAFGMEVIAHDLPGVVLPESVHAVDAPTLYRRADVVACCLPLHAATSGFVDKAAFAEMGRGRRPLFLNTARGAIVDEAALLAALDGGQVRGAAVDVLDGENDFNGDCASHPLVAYARRDDRLVITPHIAGSTEESLRKTALFIGEKIKALRTARP